MADSHRVKMQNQTGENPKAVASPYPGSSFSEPYEARIEGEGRRDLKHVAAGYIKADEDGAQIAKPTGKARADASEANDNKQGVTRSCKKQRNGASKIRSKDQVILRRSPHNRAKEDEHAVKHATPGYIEEADEDKAQKSRATGKVRAGASDASDKNQGIKHSKKRKQRNEISEVKTKSKGHLRQLPHNKTEEEMQDVNINPSNTQTEEKLTLEIPDLLQQGNAVDSEIRYSQQSLSVPMAKENATSEASGQKDTNQSGIASLENRTSKGKGAKQVVAKKCKPNAHEVAKRLVILELAKHRGTVSHESGTTELKERTRRGNGDKETKASKLNASTEPNNEQVEEQTARAVTTRFSKQKYLEQQITKRQSMNEGIHNASRDKNLRPDGSSRSKHEKSKSAQSPCTQTSHHLPEETEDVSARKTRVMQSLGLIAPSGSPFCRKRLVQA